MGVVKDGHDAHQTDRDEVKSIGIHDTLHLKFTHFSRIMTDSHFSLVLPKFDFGQNSVSAMHTYFGNETMTAITKLNMIGLFFWSEKLDRTTDLQIY
jgi:hypothetical protein